MQKKKFTSLLSLVFLMEIGAAILAFAYRAHVRHLMLKIGQVKKWHSPVIIEILKALFNLSMLANFQTNRMILAIFIGLERAMMDFFGKNHHLGIIFPASANNVRLTSKLNKMYRKESSTRFWVIRSRVEVHWGAIDEHRNFGHKLWVFFSTMSHAPQNYRAPEK